MFEWLALELEGELKGAADDGPATAGKKDDELDPVDCNPLGPAWGSVLAAAGKRFDCTVLEPAVLGPEPLGPAVLDPAVLGPAILDPAMLGGGTVIGPELNPAVLSPTVLGPAVLGPAVLVPVPAMLGGGTVIGPVLAALGPGWVGVLLVAGLLVVLCLLLLLDDSFFLYSFSFNDLIVIIKLSCPN